MTLPRPLEGDPSRQAVASFAGAVYQAWLSIDAWLRLRDDDEVIFLEGAEDFDVVGGRGPDTAVQARHTAGSISLGNAKAREALENFWLLAEREPERLVHMHYLTTSSPVQERDGNFGGLHGIDAWRAARTSSELANSVAQYMASKLNAGSALRQFLEAASPDVLQERLFKKFHWFTEPPAPSHPQPDMFSGGQVSVAASTPVTRSIELAIPDRAEIPHGHGRSFKRGIVAGLMQEPDNKHLPNGHDQSFKRGEQLGAALLAEVAKLVKD